MSDKYFFECISPTCRQGCILVFSNDIQYDPKTCPFLVSRDSDDAKFERIWDKVTITRKY